MQAMRRSGKRVRSAPWQTIVAIVSSIGRFWWVIILKAFGLNGSISWGPVQSAW